MAGLACDCHIHLYDTRDPRWAGTRPGMIDASLMAYEDLRARLGTTRAIVVQPLLYGDDNGFMLAMLRAFGTARARGIAIASSRIEDRALDALREAGVAGLRFFVGSQVRGAGTAQEALREMAALDPRLAERGMHLQVNTHGRFLMDHAAVFEGFRSPIVFDHLGHVEPRAEGGYLGLTELLSLLGEIDAWVKLSGLYLDSRTGGRCEDMAGAIEALAAACPDRVLWGTNWPHPTVHRGENMPDDLGLMETVRKAVGEFTALDRLFSANAGRLYFAS